jgi:hypothetical protein
LPRALFIPPPPRTIPNLRHPIASFVAAIVAVVLLGVCVLAATGQGALPLPALEVANCGPPTSTLLGAPGAQFTANLPADARLVALDNACSYVFSADPTGARTLVLGVNAYSGAVSEEGAPVSYGARPGWVLPAEVQRVSRDGTGGSEAFRCNARLDWCYGWLQVRRRHVTWVVLASGNGASLRTLEAFVRSFQPAS